LNRIVSYVDILEVPDIAKWLRGEVLLLTTGYAIKDDPDKQEKLIIELAQHNASGIIIKLNRFLDSIPNRMIKKANELELPIIQMPSDIPYIEVTHPLLKEILLKQNKERWTSEKLREILGNDFSSTAEISRKLKQLNGYFNTQAPVAIVVMALNHTKPASEYVKIEKNVYSDKIISGEINGHYIFICTVKSHLNWKDELEELLFKTNIIDDLSKNCTICISRLIKNLNEIKGEYEKIKSAIGIIDQLNVKKDKFYYDDIIHYVFLNSICDLDKTKKFIEYVLKPFNVIETKEREILIKTLHAYVKNGGNLTQASKSLFLHRNTFIYRMNKLKKITNISLDSHDELFKYNIAISLYELINKYKHDR